MAWTPAVPRRAAAVLAAAVAVVLLWALLPGLLESRLNYVHPGAPAPIGPRAARLHASSPVADLHADPLLWDRDLAVRGRRGHTDLPRMAEGNVALQVFAVVTKSPRGLNFERNGDDTDDITPLAVLQRRPTATWTSLKERALHQARLLEGLQARAPGRFVLVRSRAELQAALESRKSQPALVAGLLALEGAHPLEGRLENLPALETAGFRMIGLAHFFDNEVSGSAHGLEKGGLTDLGRALLKEMEARRLLVDLAHASPAAVTEVLALARRPVVVSHTGVQATCPGPRNLTDGQLRSLAANGALVGIAFFEGAVCGRDPAAVAKAVRHAADVMGLAHVALGSDFDGAVGVPFDAAGLPRLTQALLDEGFSEADVRALLGGNALSFLLTHLP